VNAAFSRSVCDGDIIERLSFCRPLPETAKVQDVLDVVGSYFDFHAVSWKSCISIFTDGAPILSGNLKGFVALAKQKNPGIVFTQCFLHK
jgi:hypothetical protein